MNIVGLTGLAGAGKDTVAGMLVRDHGFVRVALADGMKRICADVFAFTREQLWGPSEMRNAPDTRFRREHSSDRPMGRCDCCGADLDAEVDHPTPCFLTPRYALQLLGTEWGRACFEDVWVAQAMRIAERLLGADGNQNVPEYTPWRGLDWLCSNATTPRPAGVVISDVRFDNEARAIRAVGGRIVRIQRRGAGLSGGGAAHASERGIALDLVSGDLANDGTLEHLAHAVSLCDWRPRRAA